MAHLNALTTDEFSSPGIARYLGTLPLVISETLAHQSYPQAT